MLDPLRMAIICAALAGAGTAISLSTFRWFRNTSLSDRLLPFNSGETFITQRQPLRESILKTSLPTFSLSAERLARVLGVEENLVVRLQRAGWKLEPSDFRTKQFGWAAASLGLTLLLLFALRPPPIVVPVFVVAAPLLALLAIEQQLISATSKRQFELFNELPVISEQLAMLLSAGYSVGGALNRLAERNSGICGEELRIVTERIRLGLSIKSALKEWAERANVPELFRLVAILTLSDEAGDLGRLVAAEAATIRKEAHRQMLATIEKRGQQVWIPVTVATLVPGVIFLIIPFLQALSLFSSN